MFGHDSQDVAADAAAEGAAAAAAEATERAGKAAGKAAATVAGATEWASKVGSRAAAKVVKARAKAAKKAAAQDRKAAKASSKLRRAESKASVKASKAATEASKAAAAEAATRPARVVDRLTDPKTAKRALSVGKVLAPALAPFAIKAAIGARGFLDHQRAHRLGVSVGEVAQFRGPTGATGARISGLSRSIDELAARKNNDLQVTRFTEVSRGRLDDLTTAVQASASMPRPQRAKVLRAINRELDQISADLMTHLVGYSAA